MTAKRWVILAIVAVGLLLFPAGYYVGYTQGFVAGVQVRGVHQFGTAVDALLDEGD